MDGVGFSSQHEVPLDLDKGLMLRKLKHYAYIHTSCSHLGKKAWEERGGEERSILVDCPNTNRWKDSHESD